jgi:hypothetical protein
VSVITPRPRKQLIALTGRHIDKYIATRLPKWCTFFENTLKSNKGGKVPECLPLTLFYASAGHHVLVVRAFDQAWFIGETMTYVSAMLDFAVDVTCFAHAVGTSTSLSTSCSR